MTRGIRKLYLESLVVDFHFHALVGKLFKELNKTAGAEAELAFALSTGHLKPRSESILLVRTSNGECVALETDMEIVKNRESVLRIDNLAYSRGSIVEGFA